MRVFSALAFLSSLCIVGASARQCGLCCSDYGYCGTTAAYCCRRTFDVDDHRRSDLGLFGGWFFTSPYAFDPFTSSRSVSQLLSMMDPFDPLFMDNPFLTASCRLGAGLRRSCCDVWEDGDAFYVRMDMPGLAKENVKVSVEQHTLIIKGQAESKVSKGPKDEEGGRRYSTRINLPQDAYKRDQIEGEMRNGVLRVTVPKVKEEEREGVFRVQVS